MQRNSLFLSSQAFYHGPNCYSNHDSYYSLDKLDDIRLFCFKNDEELKEVLSFTKNNFEKILEKCIDRKGDFSTRNCKNKFQENTNGQCDRQTPPFHKYSLHFGRYIGIPFKKGCR